MYLHDYYFAYSGGEPGSYSNAKTAWLHLSKCDSGAPYSYEWTMSRVNSTYTWYVHSTGAASYGSDMTGMLSVRPVFYLTSDVQYISGDGLESNPFIIE